MTSTSRTHMSTAPDSDFAKLLQPAHKLTTPLPAEGDGTWPEAVHVWDEKELDALAAAAFSGRPLLVRGEPGVGKSQLARAAAALLQWRLVYQVITPRFEPEHLKWRYDLVLRLSDATCKQPVDIETRYISPGVLWQALDPKGVQALTNKAGAGDGAPASAGCVLLLDEIDKSDSDLPNSLLEVLANRAFHTPLGRVPADPKAQPQLLIVITSNDERELPLAFLRRCVVLDLAPPESPPQAFVNWLLQRGAAQFPGLDAAVRKQAAVQVQVDRAATQPGQGARPGGAEYLDLLAAVQGISPSAGEQKKWLKRLGRYVLRKQGHQQDDTVGTAAEQED